MKSCRTLFTIAASVLLMGVYAQAQDDDTNIVKVVSKTDKDEAVVSMTFDEAPLSDVIKAFRDATGANIISSGTNLQQTVSVRLDKVPWQKGLTSILEPQGLQLVEKPVGSGIYLVSVKTVEIPLITKTFQLSNARVADVEELFTNVLGDIGKATAFPAANTIIVTAPEKELNEIEMILNAIDAPSKQVYIEARFVEMSATAGKELGIKWDSLGGDGWGAGFDGATFKYQNDKLKTVTKSNVGEMQVSTFDGDGNELTSMTSSVVPDYINRNELYTRSRNFNGSLSVNALKIALNAFENNDGISIFSNPKVIVANEQRAKIDMTTKIPNIEVDYQAATTEGMRDSVSTKLVVIPGEEEPFVGEAFFSYGITLEVTPRVSSSGLITVTIEPTISDLVGYFDVQGLDETVPVGKFPIIDMQRIQTVFTMESGRTAVIGGLSITEDTNKDSGIPFLKNLPWIGPRLFGWKGRSQEQREIVILVTVGIADPVTIEQDAGMPRNAVLSRDVMEGRIKEPYLMNREELSKYTDKLGTPPSEEEELEAAEEAVEAAVNAAEAAPAKKAEEPAVTEKEAAALQPILAN